MIRQAFGCWGTGLFEERRPDPPVLMIWMHGDRLDRGERSIRGQIQDPDDGASVHCDQFGTRNRDVLDVITSSKYAVPRKESTRHTGASPAHPLADSHEPLPAWARS
jgi:hypothetical protein